ncbi:uncharacterized protein LOC8258215 isoform X1 [Ricinus communis]|uniref:Phospholipase A22 n=2 Tax=Ricinus communis TaxID=3988 RepID=B9SJ74_RICCO|nr:uncharacterized protein LOC8258215 isoform X1 [Ricinus communis]EEF36320.1 Phospholipase A22 [Ricinus communis]|eukprot:XP_002526043.3 uncharacterized protein LOC8258215 isoform X1 [Ricinus communis]
MNCRFLGHIPWCDMHSDKDLATNLKSSNVVLSMGATTTTTTIEKPMQVSHSDFKLWGWSLLSFVPWGTSTKDNVQSTTIISEGLKITDNDLGTSLKPTTPFLSGISTTTIEKPRQNFQFDIKLLAWSLLSLVPWAINARDSIRTPTTINKGLKRRAQSRHVVQNSGSGGTSLRFRPYVSKVPWHTGPRGFLSQLFPRYGHYCGPNWSSGKDRGSLLWDKRPIDWLDYCCYCHDIGYDTHDQAKLLKSDLEFLECLERPNMITKGDNNVARVYKTMCITGLRNFLIPYRTQLVNLQFGRSMLNFGWLSNVKWRCWKWQKS